MNNGSTNPDSDPLAAEIDERLRSLPNHTTAAVRALRREYSRRLKNAPAETVLRLALRLIQYLDFLHRFIGYELVGNHRAALASLGEQEIEQLGEGLDSWYAVDSFAPIISGVAWREGQIGDEVIHRWARSEDRWRRRAALVSTIPLNMKSRGGAGDAPRTLAVCAMLADDRDDMVVKALSWALRELAERDPGAVRAFLTQHEDRLAARVLREVRNKLATGLKNPRRR